MEKEQALEQFLKTLRITLNYISLYSRAHRTFLASVRQLKGTLEQLFPFFNPVRIDFSPDSISVAGTIYSKPLHREIARIFHSRKTKSISFSRGITEQELVCVLDKVSLPVRDIVQGGGLGAFLPAADIPHFVHEELDYSQLLKDEGEETSDIWSYLLKNSLEEVSVQKLDEFIDTFEGMIPKITARSLLDDDKLRQNIRKLLAYLREKNETQFIQCSKGVLRSVIKDKTVVFDQRFGNLKELFSDLNIENLSSVLWEGLSSDEHFDNTSLELFSRLVEPDKHEKIADLLVKHAGKEKIGSLDVGQMKRMKNIFSSLNNDASYIPPVYRKAILQISEEHYFDRGFTFERQKLQLNFDHILLYLMRLERESGKRDLAAKKILGSWDRVTGNVDQQFFCGLGELVAAIPEGSGEVLDELALKYWRFIEDGVWNPGFPDKLRSFALSIKKSTLGPEIYLRRIFKSGQCPPIAVRLFFRLFPERVPEFYAAMGLRSGDLEFMSELVGCVKLLEARAALEALKTIFSTANELVKIEAVKAMAEVPLFDREFLFSQLVDGNYFLKKEVMLILMNRKPDLQAALEVFLLMPNPWGQRNVIVLENIAVVEEINCRAARQCLEKITRKNFLFYSSIARKARSVLEKWDA